MRWVRNKLTGLVHSVNDDHWALQHPDYEEVQDPDQNSDTQPPPDTQEEPKRGRRK